jgi:hypothetical protein
MHVLYVQVHARRHIRVFLGRDLTYCLIAMRLQKYLFEDAQLPSHRTGPDGTGNVLCADVRSALGHVFHVQVHGKYITCTCNVPM